MRKIFGISLIAVFAVMPMMANATAVAGDPGATVALANAEKAENNPGYALAQADSQKDGKVATAGYVKGAYNAAIKAINTVAGQVANIQENAVTTTGVIATINDASATYTPAGSVANSSLTVVNSWGDDGTADIEIAAGAFTGTQATINPQVSTYNDGTN